MKSKFDINELEGIMPELSDWANTAMLALGKRGIAEPYWPFAIAILYSHFELSMNNQGVPDILVGNLRDHFFKMTDAIKASATVCATVSFPNRDKKDEGEN